MQKRAKRSAGTGIRIPAAPGVARRSDWNLPLCRAQKKKMQKRRRQVRWCRAVPSESGGYLGAAFWRAGQNPDADQEQISEETQSRTLTENGSRSCW